MGVLPVVSFLLETIKADGRTWRGRRERLSSSDLYSAFEAHEKFNQLSLH